MLLFHWLSFFGFAFMVIGVLQIELEIPEAQSLKDKRRVIKSLKDRLANVYNISIAEVGALDAHQRSIIAIAMVSNDKRYTEGALSKIMDVVRSVPQANLLDYKIELW